jgi:hypothetical protein
VNPTLRTAWAMLNLPSLVALLVALGAMASTPWGPKFFRVIIPIAIALCFALLATHISRVLRAGIWRLLPDGFPTAVRAVASIVLALSIVFGTIHRLIAPSLLGNVPLGTILALFIHLSLFGFVLLLGTGRNLPRLLIAFYFLPCVILLGIALDTFEDVPAFWIAGAAVCAVAWTIASFANIRAPNYPRRRSGWIAALGRALANADRTLAIDASPASRVLRLGSVGLGNVLGAILSIGLVALMQHATLGRLEVVPFHFFVLVPILLVGGFAAVHARLFAAPAKRLWLSWAESRRQIFRLVERTAIRDVCVVAVAGWASVVGLALLRGVEIDPVNSIKLLVTGLGVAITLAYAGMLHATAYRWWSRLLVIALGAFCLLESTDWWFAALGVGHPAAEMARSRHAFDPVWLAAALATILILRHVALARWKRIDWSHYRFSRSRK